MSGSVRKKASLRQKSMKTLDFGRSSRDVPVPVPQVELAKEPEKTVESKKPSERKERPKILIGSTTLAPTTPTPAPTTPTASPSPKQAEDDETKARLSQRHLSQQRSLRAFQSAALISKSGSIRNLSPEAKEMLEKLQHKAEREREREAARVEAEMRASPKPAQNSPAAPAPPRAPPARKGKAQSKKNSSESDSSSDISLDFAELGIEDQYRGPFKSVGKSPGIEMWRIEKMQPVKLPDKEYGTLYDGDCYLLLFSNPSDHPGTESDFRIHYWLGAKASMDKSASVAIRAVELNDRLKRQAQVFKEEQGEESRVFKGYFGSGIKLQHGSTGTGFQSVTRHKPKPRLYQVRGNGAKTFVEPAELVLQNLDHVKAWIWKGSNSPFRQKIKAMDTAQNIRQERMGRLEIIELEVSHLSINVTKANVDDADPEFWAFFDRTIQPSGIQLYKEAEEHRLLSLFQLAPKEGKLTMQVIEQDAEFLSKTMLDSRYVYIVDAESEIYVWNGKASHRSLRNLAMVAADRLLKEDDRVPWAIVTRVVEFAEPALFRELFFDWQAVALHILEEKRREALEQGLAEVQQQSVQDILKKLISGKVSIQREVDEQELPFEMDDESVVPQFYVISPKGAKKVKEGKEGFFKETKSYIVVAMKPERRTKTLQIVVYCWEGKRNPNMEKDYLTFKLSFMKELLGKREKLGFTQDPVVFRIPQGREPDHFLTAMNGELVILRAQSEDVDLYHIRGSDVDDTKCMQIEPRTCRLTSSDTFILQTPHIIYVWFGKGSNEAEQEVARGFPELLDPDLPVKVIKEFSEPEEFWDFLGGPDAYATSAYLTDDPDEPRLFTFTRATGAIDILEILPFAQQDLSDNSIFILNAHDTVWLWLGSGCDEAVASIGAKVAQSFADYLHAPMIQTGRGQEPLLFACHFHGWEDQEKEKPNKGKVWVDPRKAYQEEHHRAVNTAKPEEPPEGKSNEPRTRVGGVMREAMGAKAALARVQKEKEAEEARAQLKEAEKLFAARIKEADEKVQEKKAERNAEALVLRQRARAELAAARDVYKQKQQEAKIAASLASAQELAAGREHQAGVVEESVDETFELILEYSKRIRRLRSAHNEVLLGKLQVLTSDLTKKIDTIHYQLDANTRPDAAKTKVSGKEWRSAVVGEFGSFSVELFDKYGQPFARDVNAIQAFYTASSKEIPLIAFQASPGVWTLTYEPIATAGEYPLHILVNGQPIPESPFTLEVKPFTALRGLKSDDKDRVAADAQKTVVETNSLQGETGAPGAIRIQLYDEFGKKLRKTGGIERINASLLLPSSSASSKASSSVPLKVVDLKTGQYELLVPPLAEPGQYEVEIQVKVPGVPYMVSLPESPYVLDIAKSKKYIGVSSLDNLARNINELAQDSDLYNTQWFIRDFSGAWKAESNQPAFSEARFHSPANSSESWGSFSPDPSLSASLSGQGFESPTLSIQHSDDLLASPAASEEEKAEEENAESKPQDLGSEAARLLKEAEERARRDSEKRAQLRKKELEKEQSKALAEIEARQKARVERQKSVRAQKSTRNIVSAQNIFFTPP